MVGLVCKQKYSSLAASSSFDEKPIRDRHVLMHRFFVWEIICFRLLQKIFAYIYSERLR